MGVLSEPEIKPEEPTIEEGITIEEKPAVIPYDELPLPHELDWGQSYRVLKSEEHKVQVKPKHSPVNIPFKLCRALQKLCKKRKKCACPYGDSVSAAKISLADRSALTQSQYMDLLSTPNKTFKAPKTKKKKRGCRPRRPCRIEPCPPRLVQMAVPKRRYVLENWKQYQYFLPAEIITRFDRIVNSGNNNLEPEDARYYFKKLDRAERKRRRALKKKRQKKKKPNIELAEAQWIDDHVSEVVDVIVEFIRKEPLFLLNFKQMMVSNVLLGILCERKCVKVRSRRTKCLYKKNVIDISDKFVKWLDSIATVVDLKPLMSKEELALLEIPSIEELGESEEMESEEEEEESEIESELYSEIEEGEEIDIYGKGDQELEPYEEFDAKKLLDRSEFFGEGEGSTLDFLEGLEDDALQRLIAILAASPDDFLDVEIDPENLPTVTYRDVLDRLREIQAGNVPPAGDPLLGAVMLEWAKNNAPEEVDNKIMDKIDEMAQYMSDFMGRKRPEAGEDGQEAAGDEVKLEPAQEEEFVKEQAPADQEAGLKIEEEIIPDSEFETGTAPPKGEEEGEGEEEEEEEGEGEESEGEGVVSGEEGEGLEGEAFEGGEGELGEEEEELEAGEELEEELAEELAEEMLEEEEEPIGIEEMLEEEEEVEALGEEEALEEEEEEGLGEEEPLEGKEMAVAEPVVVEGIPPEGEELWGLGIIKGHKPPVVYEHAPDTICCLSLKIWAHWLLEVAQNAHKWTTWTSDIIKQVRHFAAIVRGDIKQPDGKKRILYKDEWRRFVKETEQSIIAWRQYSDHVKKLSDEIIENFHGKKVNCCPKCLQDHMIKNVVTAHETLRALTEAMNCAGYWQRCLDNIVEQTRKLTLLDFDQSETEASESGSSPCSESSTESSTIDIQEEPAEDSSESIYEIEEIGP